MTARLSPRQIDTAGATTAAPWLKWDQATNRLVWSVKPSYAMSELSDLDATTPITDGQVWAWSASLGKYVAAPMGGSIFKSSQTGVVTIHGIDDPAESIVPGMDAANVVPGRPATVTINLWVSQNRPGYNKYLRMRIRDGGVLGGSLYTYDFGAIGDSTAGHSQQFNQTVTVTPTTGRMVVTLQSITGALTPNDPPAVYSDTRALTVVQGGRSALRELVDVNLTGLVTGDTVVYNDATGMFEAGAAGGGGGGNANMVLLEVGQTSANVPADTPVGAIVFRKVAAP